MSYDRWTSRPLPWIDSDEFGDVWMRVTLTVTEGPDVGRTFAFDQHDVFVVGRSRGAHFHIAPKDKSFSRFHFMIEVNPPACRLLDMGSTNGTKLNGERIISSDLADGDAIQVGKSVIQVGIDRPMVRDDLESEAPHKPRAIPSSSMSTSATQPVFPILREDSKKPESNLVAPFPTIPGYQIERELGRGGMGVVYLARHEVSGRQVALKTIVPGVGNSPLVARRFLREAEILRQLDHPRIVRFHAHGQFEDRLFFAMEYVAGVNCQERVESRGRLPMDRAVKFARQALEGLAYAHARGFVHRDIKPSNLLLTKVDGRQEVKVADFGLARLYHESPMSGLTMMGEIAGSAYFMPPEQILEFRKVKPEADQYALASLLYYLLTGKLIYDFPSNGAQVLMKILMEAPVPIQTHRPEIPDALAAIIHRALARDPQDRFPDAVAMSEALEDVQKSHILS